MSDKTEEVFQKSTGFLGSVGLSIANAKWNILILYVFAGINSLKVGWYLLGFYTTWNPVNMVLFHSIFAFALALPIWGLALRSFVVACLFWTLQTIFLLCNFLYYDYFHAYLTPNVILQLFGEGVTTVSGIQNWIHMQQMMLFIDLPLVAIAVILLRKMHRYTRFSFVIMVTVSLVLLGGLEIGNRLKNENIQKILAQPGNAAEVNFKGEESIVKRYGLLVNMCIAVLESGNEKEIIAGLVNHRQIQSKGHDGPKPDIMVIQFESLDASLIGMKINGKLVMPFLTELSRKSFYYPYVFVYHGVGGTADAEFSVLNTTKPPLKVCALKLHTYQFPNSIVRPLKKAGYSVFAFHGNLGDFYNRKVAFPAMGFDRFYGLEVSGHANDPSWGTSDRNLFHYVLQILDRSSSPWFTYAITLTTHHPWNNYRQHTSAQHWETLPAGIEKEYLESMTWTDSAFAEFIPELISRYPNVKIFIFGDHTPGRIDRNTFRSTMLDSGAQTMEFVPLIMYGQGIATIKISGTVASFLDIGPTILDVSTVPFSISSDGESLFDDQEKFSMLPFKGRFLDRKYLYADLERVPSFGHKR